jgi:hypothetical protein
MTIAATQHRSTSAIARRWPFMAALGLVLIGADMTGLAPMPPLVGEAQALPGHPLTPLSAAGVARRTTRRMVRRSTVFINALPAGCVRASIDGVTVWRCGGTYYQPYRGRYVVVYVR